MQTSGRTLPQAATATSQEVGDVDHATLHAALAFVDEYELSDTDDAVALPPDATASDTALFSTLSLGDSTTRGETSPGREKSSVPTAAASSARMRQRDELVYLRGVVEGLEEELVTLKKRGDANGMTSETQTEEPLAFVWEELASRQYQQRQRAEVENVKLRTMLEEQIRVAKNLERVLKKRTTAELLLPPSTKRIRRSMALDDSSVFEDLLATLAEMYTEVETIFADARFDEPMLRVHQARNDDDTGPVVEVFDSRITPFDMHSVSDAVWYHMSMQSSDRRVIPFELIEFNEQFFKLEYRSSLELPRLKGTFHGKIAGRRFVEDDRIVLLWAALVDPDKIAGTSMDGVYMRQKGWTMIRRPPPPYEKAGRPVSVTQMYHIIIPEFNDHENQDEQRRKVGTLTNFVLSTVDFHLEVGRTIIENLLLDDGWKTPSTTSSPETSGEVPATNDVW